ncbi:hypothetical protein [Mesonia sp.]|uniref:hypothetical protein n=1 Tax=Mesonia sp. TaxID=1960830 RepID=UPI0017533A44|nr:hypothetical protein [Mesonia sp.]HIB36464.1 hypothetical protein [Mesonia sp.]HIO27488.1 hypothetical protein [Flavobacteriaceae bacterium]
MKHFYFFFFLISSFAFSQQQQFSGVIVADSIAFTQVNIVNLNKELGTVNNKNGEFVIDAEVGDEIVFSSVQYEPYQITVSTENIKTKNTIYLFPLVNELEEVKISNIDLTGDLTKDASTIETNPYFYPSSLGLPNPAPKMSVEDRRLYTASTGGIFTVIDILSGRMAMLKRMKEISEFEALIARAQSLVSRRYIVEDLEIPEDYLDDFFYYCAKQDGFEKFMKTADELEMIKFLTEKRKAYAIFKEWE